MLFFPKVAVLRRKEKPPPEPILAMGEKSLRKVAVKATCPLADLSSLLQAKHRGAGLAVPLALSPACLAESP